MNDFHIYAVGIVGHPGKGVIKRAKDIIPNCTTYLLKGRGHMHFLTDEEKKMIVDFC